MRLLFVHQNFPGQYLHLAPALRARGHEVRALGMRQRDTGPDGVPVHAYRVARGSTPPGAVPGLKLTETGHLADLVAIFAAKTMKKKNLTSQNA